MYVKGKENWFKQRKNYFRYEERERERARGAHDLHIIAGHKKYNKNLVGECVEWPQKKKYYGWWFLSLIFSFCGRSKRKNLILKMRLA